jgi:hypothetical protein
MSGASFIYCAMGGLGRGWFLATVGMLLRPSPGEPDGRRTPAGGDGKSGAPAATEQARLDRVSEAAAKRKLNIPGSTPAP